MQCYDRYGDPMCPKYHARVLPDENDLCSLCGEHSASTTYYDLDSGDTKWMTLAQLKEMKGGSHPVHQA